MHNLTHLSRLQLIIACAVLLLGLGCSQNSGQTTTDTGADTVDDTQTDNDAADGLDDTEVVGARVIIVAADPLSQYVDPFIGTGGFA